MSVFLKAIHVLQERGWTQGTYEDEEGRVCMSKAIGIANGFGCWTWKEAAPLYEASDGAITDIIDWNDDPSTTYEDVVLVLKRAHEAWEEAQ